EIESKEFILSEAEKEFTGVDESMKEMVSDQKDALTDIASTYADISGTNEGTAVIEQAKKKLNEMEAALQEETGYDRIPLRLTSLRNQIKLARAKLEKETAALAKLVAAQEVAEAEAARLAEEKAAEATRLAEAKAEEARLAKEKAVRLRRIEEEEAAAARLAKEKADKIRIAEDEAEVARLAEEKATEVARLAEAKAEEARLAEEKAVRLRRIEEEEAAAARLAALAPVEDVDEIIAVEVPDIATVDELINERTNDVPEQIRDIIKSNVRKILLSDAFIGELIGRGFDISQPYHYSKGIVLNMSGEMLPLESDEVKDMRESDIAVVGSIDIKTPYSMVRSGKPRLELDIQKVNVTEARDNLKMSVDIANMIADQLGIERKVRGREAEPDVFEVEKEVYRKIGGNKGGGIYRTQLVDRAVMGAGILTFDVWVNDAGEVNLMPYFKGAQQLEEPIVVPLGENYIVGRNNEKIAGVSASQRMGFKSMSGKHFSINVAKDALGKYSMVIMDLNSSNGTTIAVREIDEKKMPGRALDDIASMLSSDKLAFSRVGGLPVAGEAVFITAAEAPSKEERAPPEDVLEITEETLEDVQPPAVTPEITPPLSRGPGISFEDALREEDKEVEVDEQLASVLTSLKNEDAGIREATIGGLLMTELADQMIEPLGNMVEDDSGVVRLSAIRALARFKESADASKAVGSALKDKNVFVRSLAASALSEIQAENSANLLRQAYISEESLIVREEIEKSLKAMREEVPEIEAHKGAGRADEAVWLNSEEFETAWTTAGTPRGLDNKLKEILKQLQVDAAADGVNVEVRVVSRDQLNDASAQYNAAKDFLRILIADDIVTNPTYRDANLRFETRKGYPTLRLTHIEALEWPIIKEDIERYIGYLTNDDAGKRMMAIDLLVKLGQPKKDMAKTKEKYRKRIMYKHPEYNPEEIRRRLDEAMENAEWLSKQTESTTLSNLYIALSSENSDLRRIAIEILGKIGDDKSIERLIYALNDEDSDVRYAAAWALGKFKGSEQAMAALEGTLESDNVVARIGAANALVNTREENNLDIVRRAVYREATPVARDTFMDSIAVVEGARRGPQLMLELPVLRDIPRADVVSVEEDERAIITATPAFRKLENELNDIGAILGTIFANINDDIASQFRNTPDIQTVSDYLRDKEAFYNVVRRRYVKAIDDARSQGITLNDLNVPLRNVVRNNLRSVGIKLETWRKDIDKLLRHKDEISEEITALTTLPQTEVLSRVDALAKTLKPKVAPLKLVISPFCWVMNKLTKKGYFYLALFTAFPAIAGIIAFALSPWLFSLYTQYAVGKISFFTFKVILSVNLVLFIVNTMLIPFVEYFMLYGAIIAAQKGLGKLAEPPELTVEEIKTIEEDKTSLTIQIPFVDEPLKDILIKTFKGAINYRDAFINRYGEIAGIEERCQIQLCNDGDAVEYIRAWDEVNPNTINNIVARIQDEVRQRDINLYELSEDEMLDFFNGFVNSEDAVIQDAIARYREKRDELGKDGKSGFEKDENLIRNIWIRVFAKMYDLDYVTRLYQGRAPVKGPNLDSATNSDESWKDINELYGREIADKYAKHKAIGKYFLVLDADTEITEDAASRAIPAIYQMVQNPKLGWVQYESYTIGADDPDANFMMSIKSVAERGYWSYFLKLREQIGFTPCNGHNCILSAKMIEEVGGWSPIIYDKETGEPEIDLSTGRVKRDALVAEDLDIVLRGAVKKDYRGKFVTYARLGEGSPDSFRAFAVQQYKFSVGSTELLWRRLFDILGAKNISLRERIDIIMNLSKFPANMVLYAMFILSSGIILFNISVVYSSLSWVWFAPAIMMMLAPNAILFSLALRRQLVFDRTTGQPIPGIWGFVRNMARFFWIVPPLTVLYAASIPYTALGAALSTYKTTFARFFRYIEEKFVSPRTRILLGILGALTITATIVAGSPFMSIGGYAGVFMIMNSLAPQLAKIYEKIFEYFPDNVYTRSLLAAFSVFAVWSGGWMVYAGFAVLPYVFAGPWGKFMKFTALTGTQLPFPPTPKGEEPPQGIPRVFWENRVVQFSGIFNLAMIAASYVIWGPGMLAPFSLTIFLITLISWVIAPYIYTKNVRLLLSGAVEKGPRLIRGAFLVPLLILLGLEWFMKQQATDIHDSQVKYSAGVLMAGLFGTASSWVPAPVRNFFNRRVAPILSGFTKMFSGSRLIKGTVFVGILAVILGGPAIKSIHDKYVAKPATVETTGRFKAFQDLSVELRRTEEWLKVVEAERQQSLRYLALNDILVGAAEKGLERLKTIETMYAEEAVIGADMKVQKAMELYRQSTKRYKDYYGNIFQLITDEVLKLKKPYSEKELIRVLVNGYEKELMRINQYVNGLVEDIMELETQIDMKTPDQKKLLDKVRDLIAQEMEKVSAAKGEIENVLTDLNMRMQSASDVQVSPEMFNEYEILIFGPVKRAKMFIEFYRKGWKKRSDELRELVFDSVMDAEVALQSAKYSRGRAAKIVADYNEKIEMLKKQLEKARAERTRQRGIIVQAAIKAYGKDPAQLFPFIERLFDLRGLFYRPHVLESLINDLSDPSLHALMKLNNEPIIERIETLRKDFMDYQRTKKEAVKILIREGIPVSRQTPDNVRSPRFFNSEEYKHLSITMMSDYLKDIVKTSKALNVLSADVGLPHQVSQFDVSSRDAQLLLKALYNSPNILPPFKKLCLEAIEGYARAKEFKDISNISASDLISKLNLVVRDIDPAAKVEQHYLANDAREVKRRVIREFVLNGIPSSYFPDTRSDAVRSYLAEIDDPDFPDTYKFKSVKLKKELKFIDEVIKVYQKWNKERTPENMKAVMDSIRFSPVLESRLKADIQRNINWDRDWSESDFVKTMYSLRELAKYAVEREKVTDEEIDEIIGELRLKVPNQIAYLKEMAKIDEESDVLDARAMAEEEGNRVIGVEEEYSEALGEFTGNVMMLKAALTEIMEKDEVEQEYKDLIRSILDNLDTFADKISLDIREIQSQSEVIKSISDSFARSVRLKDFVKDVLKRRMAREREIIQLLERIRLDLEKLRDIEITVPLVSEEREIGISDIFKYVTKLRKDHILNAVIFRRDLVFKKVNDFEQAKKLLERLPEGAEIPEQLLQALLRPIAIPQQVMEKYSIDAENTEYSEYSRLLKKINMGIPIERVLLTEARLPGWARFVPPEEPIIEEVPAETRTVTVEEALSKGVKNSLKVARSLVRIDQAIDEEKLKRIELLYPRLDMLVGYDEARGAFAGVGAFAEVSPEKIREARLSQIDIDLADSLYKMTIRDEVTRIMKLWIDLFVSEFEINAIKEFIDNEGDDVVRAAMARYRPGKVSVLDVAKTSKRNIALYNKWINAKNKNRELQTRLRSFLNIPADVNITTGIDAQGKNAQTVLSGALKVLSGFRDEFDPELLKMAHDQRYLQQLDRILRAKKLPKVFLGGDVVIDKAGITPKAVVTLQIPIVKVGVKQKRKVIKLKMELGKLQWDRYIQEKELKEKKAEAMSEGSQQRYAHVLRSLDAFRNDFALTLEEYRRGSPDVSIEKVLILLGKGETEIGQQTDALNDFANSQYAYYRVRRVPAERVAVRMKPAPVRPGLKLDEVLSFEDVDDRVIENSPEMRMQ
ncbi:HEAT repeat domain-containing protein, partial [Candidatus Auribacterota bacterium]